MNKIFNKILAEMSYSSGDYLLAPVYLGIILTWRCNFKCRSCSVWQKKSKKQNLKNWLKAIKKINKALPPDTFVEITGGEPLLEKENLLKIIKRLKKHFKIVLINTNGSLINKTALFELEKAGLDAVKISLYSLNPTIHNQMRGNFIAFDNAMKVIKLISKSKLKLKIAILITRQNIKQIPKLIYYLKRWPKIEITLQPLDELIDSKESKNLLKNQLPQNLWPKKNDVLKFFSWVIKNKRLVNKGMEHLLILRNYYLDPKTALSNKCFSGQRNIIINPDGGISLCYKYPAIGNIFKDNLKDILKKEAKKQRLEIKDCKKYCRVLGCNYARSFSSVLKNTIKIKQ